MCLNDKITELMKLFISTSFRASICIILILFQSLLALSQRGKDGDYSVNGQNEWLNAYTFLTSDASSGSNTIIVQNNSLSSNYFVSDLEAGDLLLIYQTQGGQVDVNTLAVEDFGGNYTAQNSWNGFGGTNPDWDETEYGQVLDYESAGFYEFVEVETVQGSQTIVLNCSLTHSYISDRSVQVIRVPRFENLVVENNASISAPMWNGVTGGLIAIEVNQDLSLNGTAEINASEIGFRGGEQNNQSALSDAPGGSLGFLGSFAPNEGAEKGEGIYGYHTEYDAIWSRFCRGAIANGGGGSNYHNGGGGGGSNIGVGQFTGKGVPNPGANNAFVAAWNLEDPNMLNNPSSGGGRGGYSHGASNNNPLVVGPNQAAWQGDFRRQSGGIGGHPLVYDENRVFFGGGGGAGDGNDGYAGVGGRGGGAVFLKVYGNIEGNGSIRADGQKGGNASGATPPTFSTARTGDDGAGGGGGGGAVIIQNIQPIPSTVRLFARGGDGGDQNVQIGNFGSMSCEGPGGGGAGGMIAFSDGNPQQNVSGGQGGITNSSFVPNFNLNGATGGAQGMSDLSTTMFDILVEDVLVCGEENVNLTVVVVGNLPSGSVVQWFETPYGGTPVNTGTSFTTPVINESTSYFVGTCPSSFRKEIQINFSPEIIVSGTPNIVNESCAGNDGSITGLVASGGEGILSFSWSNSNETTIDAENLVGGDYFLEVSDENGCSITEGSFTVGDSPGPSIDFSQIAISPETCLGNDGAISGISVSGDGLSYEWNNESTPDASISGISAGEYTLVVTDENECTQFAGPFQVPSEGGPTVDASLVQVQDETCFGNDGSISGITASGSGLTFEWNGEESGTIDLNDATEGEYSLIVFDEDGCQTVLGPYTIGLNDGPEVDTTGLIILPEICEGNDGEISGIVIISPFQTLSWNDGFSDNLNLEGLSAGSYTLTITDDIGCERIIGPIEVQNLASPTLDISSIVIQEESCFENDGAITGISAEGNGLSFNWNDGLSTNLDLTDVEAGTYLIEVIDTNGCQSSAGPFEIEFNPGPTLNSQNVSISNETCLENDGAISGLIASGSGLRFFWNGIEQPSIDLINAESGIYTLVVEDQNGCSVTFGPATIEQDPLASFSVQPNLDEIIQGQSTTLNATISPEIEGEVNWVPASSSSCTDCFSNSVSPSETTTFIATFTTPEGCVYSDTALVIVKEECKEPFVPTIFSPNDDGLNDWLCVKGECIQQMEIVIFNRWGEVVFESKAQEDCWDGTFKGQKMNAGVVAYKLNGKLIDGSDFELSGNISLVR